jgi:hypothetical protein
VSSYEIAMRRLLYLIPVGIVVAVLGYAWYDPDPSRTLLARAITAHGGEVNLAKSRKGRVAGTGKMPRGHFLARYTWEEYFDLPERYKRVGQRGSLGQTSVMTELFRDGKVWAKIDDEEPDVRTADRPSRQCIASLLGELVDLRKEKVALRPLPETLVLDRPALGLEASPPNGSKVELYFDKESALLLKLATHGGPNDLEMTFSGYREFSGIALPVFVQVYRSGRLMFEETTTEVDFLTEINDSVFAKP